jgi:hypothetical protein
MLSAQTLGEIMNQAINLRAAVQEDEPFLPPAQRHWRVGRQDRLD